MVGRVPAIMRASMGLVRGDGAECAPRPVPCVSRRPGGGVVAGEMQRAMHDQMREVVRRATPLGRGLASYDTKREQHLWRRSAVSQHIGGLVLLPVARVQAANR